MLHIGVLIIPPIQLLDVSPVELFSMMTKDYFQASNLPQALIDAALPSSDIKISYIAHSGPNTTAGTIPNLNLTVTNGIDDLNVAPAKLDILLIPGTDPATRPAEAVLEFVRRHVQCGVDLLVICTGVFVAAHSGVLDGKHATAPRGMLDDIMRSFPNVKWQDKRYINDGKIWTTGQITNGMDMVAAYMSQRWPNPLSKTVLNLADIEMRPPEYDTPKLGFNEW